MYGSRPGLLGYAGGLRDLHPRVLQSPRYRFHGGLQLLGNLRPCGRVYRFPQHHGGRLRSGRDLKRRLGQRNELLTDALDLPAHGLHLFRKGPRIRGDHIGALHRRLSDCQRLAGPLVYCGQRPAEIIRLALNNGLYAALNNPLRRRPDELRSRM